VGGHGGPLRALRATSRDRRRRARTSRDRTTLRSSNVADGGVAVPDPPFATSRRRPLRRVESKRPRRQLG
jgi:hypothetical protein